MRLGIMLHDYRRSRKLTLRSTSRRIGISAAALTRIECGRQCSAASFAAVLAWLTHPEGTDPIPRKIEPTSRAVSRAPRVQVGERQIDKVYEAFRTGARTSLEVSEILGLPRNACSAYVSELTKMGLLIARPGLKAPQIRGTWYEPKTFASLGGGA
jgi:transcriptional regulator with XRE-family HTH domain